MATPDLGLGLLDAPVERGRRGLDQRPPHGPECAPASSAASLCARCACPRGAKLARALAATLAACSSRAAAAATLAATRASLAAPRVASIFARVARPTGPAR